MRIKRGVAARAKHKKILAAAKGMQHYRTRSFRLAFTGDFTNSHYLFSCLAFSTIALKTEG